MPQLDMIDVYEFEYNGNAIVVVNSELNPPSITLKINGEIKAEAKGIKAVTGIGQLEAKLPSGEIVSASIQKIKLGDSECKVTVNGKAIELKNQSHGKRELADVAKSAVDNLKNK